MGLSAFNAARARANVANKKEADKPVESAVKVTEVKTPVDVDEEADKPVETSKKKTDAEKLKKE